MSVHEIVWSIVGSIVLMVFINSIWSWVGDYRMYRVLHREYVHQQQMATLMEGKDLPHFLYDNGLGDNPDPEEPQLPLPSVRGIQSVEL